MYFIDPIQITDTEFTSSTVPETDFAEWAVGTTYADGDKVISTTTHRIYESVQASNTGNDPTTDDGTWWIDIAPTNRWAMFDNVVGTVTSQATSIIVEVDLDSIVSSLALLDISAESVRIEVIDPIDGLVYDKTITTYDQATVIDWYTYFFEDLRPQTSLIINDLPSYKQSTIKLTISNSSSNAECGTFAIGKYIELGKSQYGARVGIIDYSKKDTDIFGVTSLLERTYAKKIDVNCWVDNTQVDYIANKLAEVRATPCVWVSNNDSSAYSSLVVYGFYKDWQTVISYPTVSILNMSIEGLT